MATPNSVFSVYFSADDAKIKYSRQVYTFLDLAGDIGGLYEVIEILSHLLLAGYSSLLL